MKTIAIVATGGTIAGRGQIGRAVAYHAGEMDVNEIIQSIPMLNQVAHIKEYQLMNVDSNEMTPQKWLILAKKLMNLLNKMILMVLL
ncbi:asparaginase domain-containing protein [Allocoprobacillus halotolerans]|uniref:asparaginase n=1 Tax=Allocoprobacillus halotolerans TaxID=2944914 RepID=A0ABY5I2U0_9FIRM|nr:asparaginase domain-containing protein [Allocoprobacillus halotolerans]UTY39687.1 asparaginase domain-containing protein [Allocoprobacillus halotolerans]